MGINLNLPFFIRIRLHFIFLLLLSSSSFLFPQPFFAYGRVIYKTNASEKLMEQRREMMKRELIGSRPPRCEGKCGKCGNCEAIQVPIVSRQKQIITTSHFVQPSFDLIAYSRGEYLSNYKPMCWKCKCGNSIFNP